MFDTLVHPTMRFVRAVLPQMIERRTGKIIVVTSAAPLRTMQGGDAYAAARAAQNAYVRNVGAEVARHNVQVNAIAQAFVESVDAFQRRDVGQRGAAAAASPRSCGSGGRSLGAGRAGRLPGVARW